MHSCTDTKPNIDPSRDPDYKEFKDLYQCIESKCVIQLGACQANEECNKCCKLYTPTNFVRNNVFSFHSGTDTPIYFLVSQSSPMLQDIAMVLMNLSRLLTAPCALVLTEK